MLISLNVIDHKTWFINKAKSILGFDSSSNNVIDIVLAHLPLNTKQKHIVYKIMRYSICNQVSLRFERSDQLLFIIGAKAVLVKIK